MKSIRNYYQVESNSVLHKYVKGLFLSLIFLVLNACGSGSNSDADNELTSQELAIEKISDYAQDGLVEPTLQDYLDAGIKGIDASNLSEINTVVEQLTEDDVDTEIEIQALATSLNVVLLNAPILENLLAQTYNENEAITLLNFNNNGGGTLTSCTADTLPTGLVVATSTDLSTCEITGTPTTIQSVTTHTITASNATGSDTATVSIEVKAIVILLALPVLEDVTAQNYTKDTAITLVIFTNSGGRVLTSCNADTLPAGLVVAISTDLSTCEITGIPTIIQATTTHTITATNVTGNDTATISIEVQAIVIPLVLPILENATVQSYTKDTAITPVIFTNGGGGTLTSCTADTLPAGLVVATSTDFSTCEITGTPTTVQSATTYTITATNAVGNDTAIVSIEVKAPISTSTLPNLVESSALTYRQNEVIFTFSLLNSGAGELTSCSADSLPVGLVVGVSSDATTCEITGSPQVIQALTTYSIVATNGSGNSSVGLDITVDPIVISSTSLILGSIRTITGGEIEGAFIKVYENGIQQPAQTTSNVDGEFMLTLAVNTQFTITFSAIGYANQIKRIETLGSELDIDILLLKQEPFKNVPKAGGVILGKDGAAVTLPVNAFVDLQGNELDIDDSVRSTITPLDISSIIGVETFPGDFIGVPEGETDTTPIISYGTTEITFTRSSDDKEVQLRDGQVAEIKLPIYSTKNMDGSLIALGDFIPLWSLNEVTGVWTQEGSGEVVASTASPTGFALKGEVTHFSWWNVDVPFNVGGGTSGRTVANVTVFANEKGSAVINARQDSSSFGAWVPESASAFTTIGVSNALALPAGAEVCLWADINLFSGKKASTEEVCVRPESGVPIDINLGVDSGILFIHVIPANVTSVVQAPVFIKLLPYTAEISVDYSIVSGRLPTGLILKSTDAVSAAIYGATSETGTFSATIRAVDSNGNTDDLPLDITILDAISGTNFVKKTGALSSFNQNGFKVFAGLIKDDAFYQKGVTPFYTRDNTRQTVIDNITGLEWQDDNTEEVKTVFEDAQPYCSNLVLGGSNDWRLPTKKELESIANFTKDEGNGERLSYPLEFRKNTSPVSFHWSSSLPSFVNNNNTSAFVVGFSDGTSRTISRIREMNVRCVRGVSSPLTGVFSKENGVVTDSVFNLQWKDDAKIEEIGYEEAINFCETLSLNGEDDWRLPNVKELLTVMDSDNTPALNLIFQYPSSTGSSGEIWSNTPAANRFDNGKISVSRGIGSVTSNISFTGQADVMCVRSDL